MSNMIAIAHKELRSYFASPIAYVVLAAFAVVFGFFYNALLSYFMMQSMQTPGMGGGGAVNINQMLISPLLQNAAVVILFMVPMITMRSYAEEKRMGTIELLLTSPLSDMQIILGKFFGALALYVVMLLVTLVDIAFLFKYGSPELGPVLVGYLGMLLLGGCFIALGLLISSLTRNQIVAGIITFVVFLMLWVVNWMTDFTSSTVGGILNYVSITSHLQDFARGVIDTKHVVYYLTFIAFGLFLTYEAVDTERWRG